MASAVFILAHGCNTGFPQVQEGELNKPAKIVVGCALADLAILITIVVLDILKATAVITMPAAAYYTIAGIACLIVLLHVIAGIVTKCSNVTGPASIIDEGCKQSCAKNNQSEIRQ